MAFGNRLKKVFGLNNNKESQSSDTHIIKSKENKNSSFNEDDENLSASEKTKDFFDLDNLVHSGKKEIILSENIRFKVYETDFYEGGVILDVDNLIIDGNGKTIDGANRSRIFMITGKNITLKNITFKNGHVEKNFDSHLFNNGGAIFIQIGASLTLINCKFINNNAPYDGGAIVNYGHSYLINNIFKGNYAGERGDAIYNWHHLDLSENIFHLNNQSDDFTPPIFNNDLIRIDNIESNLDELVYNSQRGSISQYRNVENNNVNIKQERAFEYHDDFTVKEQPEVKAEDNVIEEENIFSNETYDEKVIDEYSSREVYSSGWEYSRIFISSTFNDMHAERDYLVKEVFPELSEWCEERKIRLKDIDLRWGVTEEDSNNNKAIQTCLRHIDKSRPFFLCFLGQRRGWIPNFEKDISAETKERYTSVDMDGRSATEIEIEYALLKPIYMFLNEKDYDCPTSKHSLFFFREDSYLGELTDAQREIYTNESERIEEKIKLADEELAKTKDKIRARKECEDKKDETDESKANILINEYKGFWDKELVLPELNPTINSKGMELYTNGENQGRLIDFECNGKPLKDVIINQIKVQLALEFPENMEIKALTEFEENLNNEEIFCYLNSEGYIPRPEYIEKIKDYVDGSNNQICLVIAKAGYGKTMFLSNFSLEFQSKYPNRRLYKRFCGASDFSLNSFSLWKSIIDEAGIGVDEEFYPNNLDELKINFEYILSVVSNKQDSVIVIDAIDQMNDGVDMLRWLEKHKLPDNLKIVVSVKREFIQYEIASNFHYFEIKGLDEVGKRKLINQYLSNYLKTLDENQIDAICSFEASKNPLYLKILLSELRVFGSFEQLNEKIKRFGNSPVSAFKHVLDRLESDEVKTNFVPLIFSLLANARVGLSEDELINIIKSQNDFDEKSIRDSIRLNLRQIRQFMMKKDGCHDFFYDSFKTAALEKYGDTNKLLLDFFKQKADPNHDYSFLNNNENNLRALNELPFHLNSIGDYKELEKVLSSYSFIKNKLELSNIYNLMADYHFSQNHEFYKVENHPIVLIGNALELSAPILINHKDQLPAQLWGRLEGIEDNVIKNMLDELIIKTDQFWFKSKKYSLYSPYSPIIKKLDLFSEKSVTDIVFYPDKKIIWGNDDGTLNLYDLDENHYEILSKRNSKIIKIFFGENLNLYVAYANGTVVQWDIDSRTIIEYPRIDAEITDVFYSKTYEKLFLSSHEGIFSIDLRTYELRKEDIESKNYNQFLIPPVLGHTLICDERDVDGWGIYEQRNVYRLWSCFDKGYDDGIINSDDEIQFMACIDRFLILISRGGEQKIWNILKTSGGGEAIDIRHTVSSLDNFKKAIAFEDSHRIMVLSQMGCLNFWNLPNPRNPIFYKSSEGEQEINEIQTGISFPSAIAEYWCGEENWVVIGNEKNNIFIVDLDKGYNYKKHNGAVLHITIDGDEVITCSDDGEIYIWNLNNEKFKSEYSNDLRVSSVLYNYSDKTLFSAGIEANISGNILNKIKILNLADEKIENYLVNSNKILDITQIDSNIIFIEENKLIIGNDEIILDKNVTSLTSNFNCNEVFVGFEDGSIVKYPDGFRFDKTIDCSISKMKIIDDNLIVGYENGSIEIFDLNGNHLNTLNSHDEKINDVCSFEKYLISASMDNTLRLWDIEANNCIYTHFLDIPATAINVGDEKLVLGDSLGNVRFFDFENLI